MKLYNIQANEIATCDDNKALCLACLPLYPEAIELESGNWDCDHCGRADQSTTKTVIGNLGRMLIDVSNSDHSDSDSLRLAKDKILAFVALIPWGDQSK